MLKQRNQYFAWALLGALCIGLQLVAESSQTWLAFDRAAVETGQWWRLITGNVVHTNFWHLWLNLAALAAILVFFPTRDPIPATLLQLLACGITVTLGIYFCSPDLVGYVGLSGILHGVFLLRARSEWAASRLTGAVMMIGLASKLLYEQLSGPSETLATLINADIATAAHFYGALGGVIVVVTGLSWSKLSRPPRAVSH